MTLSENGRRWATRMLRRGAGRWRGPAPGRLGDSSGITPVVWAIEDVLFVAGTGAGKSRPCHLPPVEATAARAAGQRPIRIITDDWTQVGL